MNPKLIYYSLVTMLGALSSTVMAFDLVRDGKAQTAIVLPDDASLVAEYAADELQWHLKAATGATVPIVREREAEGGALIFVGQGKAAQEAGIEVEERERNTSVIRTTPEALFLTGKDDLGMPEDRATRSYARNWKGFRHGGPPLDDGASMGTLFAVYQWLEDHLKVRWLWPGEGGTHVPKAKSIATSPHEERVFKPFLLHSRPRLNMAGWPGQDKALRDQLIYDTSVWLRRQRFIRGISLEYGHAYEDYWKRFGEKHPEYFAQRPDGKREPLSLKRSDLVQMCVTSEGLHRQIIEDWKVQREKHPSLPWINGAENDKTMQDPYCHCPACLAWDVPAPEKQEAGELEFAPDIVDAGEKGASIDLGRLSDRYAQFWMALLNEGKKHDPNVKVLGYAYADYSYPPRKAKLSEDVVLAVVPPYSFPVSNEERTRFHKIWKGWADTGAQLYLRPNYTLLGYCVPYIYAEEFGEEFKYAAANGMIGTDFDSLIGMWSVHGPNLYMMGRLNVDPKQEVSAILEEYYNAFGPAAKAVKAYFEHWKGITATFTSEKRAQIGGGWGVVSYGGEVIYTPETFEKGFALLEQAREAAGKDTESAARVAFLHTGLEHGALAMKTLAAYRLHKENPREKRLKDDYDNALEELDTYREEQAAVIGNIGLLRTLEGWSGMRKRDPKP